MNFVWGHGLLTFWIIILKMPGIMQIDFIIIKSWNAAESNAEMNGKIRVLC
jgi:hypothetical protein